MYGVLEDGFKENMTQGGPYQREHASGQCDAASATQGLAIIGYQQVSQDDIAKLLK